MLRISIDVPRWNVFQHRVLRKLPLVETDDSEELRFEDEIYDRLFAGPRGISPRLDRSEESRSRGAKARVEKYALPVQENCRGNAEHAALATAWICEIASDEIAHERALARALEMEELEARQLMSEGFERVDTLGFHSGYGSDVGRNRKKRDANRVQLIAELTRRNSRLREIALLAGRMKRTLAARRGAARVSAVEVTDIEQGDDLGRLLPVELSRLVSPVQRLYALSQLVEKKLAQYELRTVDPPEQLARGPIVMCQDKSGSMAGEYDVWATAVALAILEIAHAQRRTFGLIFFDVSPFKKIVLKPGDGLPVDDLLLEPDPNGGTDIWDALDAALDMIERGEISREADIVLLSDGASSVLEISKIRSRAQRLGVKIYGIGFGADVGIWCDEAHAIRSIYDMGEDMSTMIYEKVGER